LGDTVRTVDGSFALEFANMPASRTKLGSTMETPTPRSAMSWRNPRENPRRPNFVAL
jgi:hypothetical protein